MRKEVIIVVIIGILIGAIVAYGIYTAQTAIRKQQDQFKVSEQLPSPEPTPIVSHTLTIIEPANESISDQEEITITGSTTPNAVITIFTEENEYLLSADAEGAFSAAVTLIGGANDIIVTAFDEQGNRAEQVLTVVYSTAEL
jgi:hypothetical protein